LGNIAAIPIGPSKFSIPGVPFEVTLVRDDDMPPFFTVARWLDPALNVAEKLAERLAVALADKDNQLSRYHKAGNTTLLILESQDIALVNQGMIYQAFLAALAKVQPVHLDQVWLAESYEPEKDFLFIYCLLADQSFIDRVNPANMMFGPRYAKHWDPARRD